MTDATFYARPGTAQTRRMTPASPLKRLPAFPAGESNVLLGLDPPPDPRRVASTICQEAESPRRTRGHGPDGRVADGGDRTDRRRAPGAARLRSELRRPGG